MSDAPSNHQPPLPTRRQLAKATALAALGAGVVLVTTVLPAEYGIDPTGIGRLLGLTDMGKFKSKSEAPATGSRAPVDVAFRFVVPAATDASELSATIRLVQAEAPERSDEMSVTLKPNEGTEVKVFMKAGQQFKYEWRTNGGRVNFDFHGERYDAPNHAHTSYEKGARDKAEGTFQAKFDGTHGWFWRNRTSKDITVTVKTSGRYEQLKRVK